MRSRPTSRQPNSLYESTTSERLAELVARCEPHPAAAVGVDAVEVRSLKRDLEVGGQRFLERVFTPAEIEFCAGRHERLATRFAAKEAVAKALGTGIRGVDWHDIEVRSAADGAPRAVLSGAAAKAAAKRSLVGVHISLCHQSGLAIAVAVGEAAPARQAQKEVDV